MVGDTVGDPYKDTSGPAISILIKVTCVVSLVLAPWFARLHR
ncbi:MAG TPA: sodium/proton-translocating pyrophosphatase [Gemmatimonadales bacterium]|nr:sodium/proton-translocating pyrophosphatase [Gemmatimonadales bacterium]